MPGLLDGKVVVVTGGASGIGRGTSLRCAEEGAAVVLGDVRPDPREGGHPTHELIIATGGTARYVTCDVRKRDDLEALMEAAEELGGVDVLVNNAGIFRHQNFLEVDEAAFDTMFDVNVKGVYFAAQAAARRMVARRSGVIINLSSIAGIRGASGFVTYCASKGAVRFMSMALAAELGPSGVRVCSVHPGVIETSMTTADVPLLGAATEGALTRTIGLGRAGTPHDVAGGIVLLASDLAGYVTGASLLVDGGMMFT